MDENKETTERIVIKLLRSVSLGGPVLPGQPVPTNPGSKGNAAEDADLIADNPAHFTKKMLLLLILVVQTIQQ